jgi:hypothetical protein
MSNLNRDKARKLMHDVADREATEEQRDAFFRFIEDHPDIKHEFHQLLELKGLLAERFQKAEAPEHLKDKIQNLIEREAISSSADKQNHRMTNIHSIGRNSRKIFRYISAAAVILILSLVTVEFLEHGGMQSADQELIFEEAAANYFLTSGGGSHAEPDFQTASHSEAENYLETHLGMNITVPNIEGARFNGVVHAGLTNDTDIPLLEYIDSVANEPIYLFAFDSAEIDNHETLARLNKAVRSCKSDKDFYVFEYKGHHVVSWTWNGHWYSAISRHNGYELASLVEPLDYNP